MLAVVAGAEMTCRIMTLLMTGAFAGGRIQHSFTATAGIWR